MVVNPKNHKSAVWSKPTDAFLDSGGGRHALRKWLANRKNVYLMTAVRDDEADADAHDRMFALFSQTEDPTRLAESTITKHSREVAFKLMRESGVLPEVRHLHIQIHILSRARAGLRRVASTAQRIRQVGSMRDHQFPDVQIEAGTQVLSGQQCQCDSQCDSQCNDECTLHALRPDGTHEIARQHARHVCVTRGIHTCTRSMCATLQTNGQAGGAHTVLREHSTAA